MPHTRLPTRLRARAERAAEEMAWFHKTIGVAGNTLLLVGALLFLSEGTQAVGTWFFVGGSLGMLLRSLGDLVITLEADA